MTTVDKNSFCSTGSLTISYINQIRHIEVMILCSIVLQCTHIYGIYWFFIPNAMIEFVSLLCLLVISVAFTSRSFHCYIAAFVLFMVIFCGVSYKIHSPWRVNYVLFF
jgi:hypothetical protein